MWVTNKQNEIYTYLKYRALVALQTKYPNLFFTQDDSPNESPKFPCVYVHFLSPIETGRDLDNDSVNAVVCTLQVDVTVPEQMGMSAATEVSDNVVENLKRMRFSITAFPEFSNLNTNTKRKILRAERTIGVDDILF